MRKEKASGAYAKLPLAFVPNRGQHAKGVRYAAQGAGFGFFFTKEQALLSFTKGKRGTALALRFLGASSDVQLEGGRRVPGRVNYLIGRDPSKWQRNLPTYGELRYRGLWPGIDLVLRGAKGQLKYEFHVQPGARVSDVRLAYRGTRGLSLARSGALKIRTPLGVLTDTAPRSYQLVAGKRVSLASRYVLSGQRGYGFALGAGYDPARSLVIDPGLLYSTYLGGSADDRGRGIALDAAGNAYVTGVANSADFPTTAGAFDTSFNGGGDVFVTKLNPLGSGLVYSTYLGGSGGDVGIAIALDGAGSAYVTGLTTSFDLPTTPGALDTSFNGGVGDAFVAKLNPLGSGLVYSTYLGGSGFIDEGEGIAVDVGGNAHLTGITSSADFPTTAGAFDTSFNGGLFDAFVTKLNPLGSGLVYSTFLGGSGDDTGRGIALDATSNAYVTGRTDSADFPTTAGAFDTSLNGAADAYVTKLNPLGSGLVYSTFLGGSGSEESFGIALDAADSAHVTGFTASADFPTTAGAFDTSFNGALDAFVAKLDPLGSGLVYSTYLGGSGDDFAHGIALDAAGNAYLTGDSTAADFPTTAGAFDTSFNGVRDAFAAKLNPLGSGLVYATYLGGTGEDLGFGIALDSSGNGHVTGDTASADFPTTAGAFDTSFNGDFDAFVTKLDLIGAPATLVLTPATATNPVGTSHTVTATVTDAAGQPVPGVVVRFTVTGAHTLSGSCTTGTNGQCKFTYTGVNVGSDAIAAYADSDDDGVQDADEPTGAASKVWTAPTGGCPPNGGDDDEDDDGLEDRDESLLGTLHGNADSDGDRRRDGDDDSDGDGEDDEDEDDGTDDECPNDSDGDGEDDEDEHDDDGDNGDGEDDEDDD